MRLGLNALMETRSIVHFPDGRWKQSCATWDMLELVQDWFHPLNQQVSARTSWYQLGGSWVPAAPNCYQLGTSCYQQVYDWYVEMDASFK